MRSLGIRRSCRNYVFKFVGFSALSIFIMSLSLDIREENGTLISGQRMMKYTREKWLLREVHEQETDTDSHAHLAENDRHGNGLAEMTKHKIGTSKNESINSAVYENPIKNGNRSKAQEKQGNGRIDSLQNDTSNGRVKLARGQHDTDMRRVPVPPEEQLPTYQGRSPCLEESKEEAIIGFRIVNGEPRQILGVSRGDREVRKSKLPAWLAEMKKQSTVRNIEDLCKSRMTFSKLNEGEEHCPCSSPEMQGNVEIDWSPPSWINMSLVFSVEGVQQGGKRRPKNCIPRQRVAIIIPYKNRLNHLHIFINHLHRILLRQNMEYRVFVVEQAHPNIFNKAAMMNIGYLEARRRFQFDCVIFHDVDLLLENDKNLYACLKESNVFRHIASHVDKHRYKLPYTSLIGGSVGFPPAVFEKINGYSNTYWGWGGEDDDLYTRLRARKIAKVHRLTASMARFTMIDHKPGVNFPANVLKNARLRKLKPEYTKAPSDGLSSVEYKVRSVVEEALFTWVYAEMKSPLSEFFYRDGSCVDKQKAYFSSQADFQDCATECQTAERCHSFRFAYNLTNFKPSCSLFSSACEHTYISPHLLSFVYTKGRTFDTVT